MNPLEIIERRLEGKNLSEVARRAGMAYDNVHKMARGNKDDLYVSTFIKLMAVLDEMEAE
tara:strand:- start:1132 stop:1311 length:180 start_codon:yes stop_codon:yes gene_type:complete